MNAIKKISNQQIVAMGQEALTSPRKRIHFNLHESPDDPIQRMINVLEPGTYMCPHIHHDKFKREIFVILRGRLLVCLFNDGGEMIDNVILDKEGESFLVEIPAGIWHTLIPLSVHTAIFECKDGPYDAGSDKIFADWAPKEGDPEGNQFNQGLLKHLGIVFPEFM